MQLSKSGSAVVPIRAGCEGENPLSLTIQTGGPERDRTADLLLAKQALSQLSYWPLGKAKSGSLSKSDALPSPAEKVVGRTGIAPVTPALSARCSTN